MDGKNTSAQNNDGHPPIQPNQQQPLVMGGHNSDDNLYDPQQVHVPPITVADPLAGVPPVPGTVAEPPQQRAAAVAPAGMPVHSSALDHLTALAVANKPDTPRDFDPNDIFPPQDQQPPTSGGAAGHHHKHQLSSSSVDTNTTPAPGGGIMAANTHASLPTKVVESGHEHTGRWTKEEHEAFLSALQVYGKEWKKVAARVKTRTVVQTRTHAQKYFQKLQKVLEGESGQKVLNTMNEGG